MALIYRTTPHEIQSSGKRDCERGLSAKGSWLRFPSPGRKLQPPMRLRFSRNSDESDSRMTMTKISRQNHRRQKDLRKFRHTLSTGRNEEGH